MHLLSQQKVDYNPMNHPANKEGKVHSHAGHPVVLLEQTTT